MDARDLDRVLGAQLMDEASRGLMDIGTELVSLYDGWVAGGDRPDAVAWMGSILERLGFWSGRLEAAADPSLVALFPKLD